MDSFALAVVRLVIGVCRSLAEVDPFVKHYFRLVKLFRMFLMIRAIKGCCDKKFKKR